MDNCYACGRETHFCQPLVPGLPVYCLGCLFEVRARIVKDLDEQGHLQAYRSATLSVPRDWYPSLEERTEARV